MLLNQPENKQISSYQTFNSHKSEVFIKDCSFRDIGLIQKLESINDAIENKILLKEKASNLYYDNNSSEQSKTVFQYNSSYNQNGSASRNFHDDIMKKMMEGSDEDLFYTKETKSQESDFPINQIENQGARQYLASPRTIQDNFRLNQKPNQKYIGEQEDLNSIEESTTYQQNLLVSSNILQNSIKENLIMDRLSFGVEFQQQQMDYKMELKEVDYQNRKRKREPRNPKREQLKEEYLRLKKELQEISQRRSQNKSKDQNSIISPRKFSVKVSDITTQKDMMPSQYHNYKQNSQQQSMNQNKKKIKNENDFCQESYKEQSTLMSAQKVNGQQISEMSATLQTDNISSPDYKDINHPFVFHKQDLNQTSSTKYSPDKQVTSKKNHQIYQNILVQKPKSQMFGRPESARQKGQLTDHQRQQLRSKELQEFSRQMNDSRRISIESTNQNQRQDQSQSKQNQQISERKLSTLEYPQMYKILKINKRQDELRQSFQPQSSNSCVKSQNLEFNQELNKKQIKCYPTNENDLETNMLSKSQSHRSSIQNLGLKIMIDPQHHKRERCMKSLYQQQSPLNEIKDINQQYGENIFGFMAHRGSVTPQETKIKNYHQNSSQYDIIYENTKAKIENRKSCKGCHQKKAQSSRHSSQNDDYSPRAMINKERIFVQAKRHKCSHHHKHHHDHQKDHNQELRKLQHNSHTQQNQNHDHSQCKGKVYKESLYKTRDHNRERSQSSRHEKHSRHSHNSHHHLDFIEEQNVIELQGKKQKILSPSKLNQELNKILETERMIKEYKEMITKMQRDLYSKKQEVKQPLPSPKKADKNSIKQSFKSNKQSEKGSMISPAKQIKNKKVFQEDLNPTEAIKSLIKHSHKQSRVIFQNQSQQNQHEFQNPEQNIKHDQKLSQSKNHLNQQMEQESPLKEQIKTTFNIKLMKVNHEQQQKDVLNNQTFQQLDVLNVTDPSKQTNINGQLPDDDQDNTYTNFQEDESFMNAQQQQEILNFYREFQQEDETMKTPLSVFSKQQSFISHSPNTQNKRHFQQQHSQFINESKSANICSTKNSNNRIMPQINIKPFSHLSDANLSDNPFQQQLLSQQQQQMQQSNEVKIVSIQINPLHKKIENNFNNGTLAGIMKVTSDLLGKRKNEIINAGLTCNKLTPYRSKNLQIQCRQKSLNKTPQIIKTTQIPQVKPPQQIQSSFNITPNYPLKKLDLDIPKQQFQTIQTTNQNKTPIKFSLYQPQTINKKQQLNAASYHLNSSTGTYKPQVKSKPPVFAGQQALSQTQQIPAPQLSQNTYKINATRNNPYNSNQSQYNNCQSTTADSNYFASQQSQTNSLRSSMQIRTQTIDLSEAFKTKSKWKINTALNSASTSLRQSMGGTQELKIQPPPNKTGISRII